MEPSKEEPVPPNDNTSPGKDKIGKNNEIPKPETQPSAQPNPGDLSKIVSNQKPPSIGMVAGNNYSVLSSLPIEPGAVLGNYPPPSYSLNFHPVNPILNSIGLSSERGKTLIFGNNQIDRPFNFVSQNSFVDEKIKALQKDLEAEREQTANSEKKRKDLVALLELKYLTNKISPEAKSFIESNESYSELFKEKKTSNSFIVSIDIRRSTSLMLKSVSAEKFANFINDLADKFFYIITSNNGIFDKFTGDGILAFFPDFYSGDDAGYFAATSAFNCHKVFEDHYKKSRGSFKSILNNVGLGIGIDYGEVHLLKMADGLTVVGEPVVFACRLGGAPAGKTYVNHPAYQKILETSGKAFLAVEESLEVKHEGTNLAYSLSPSGFIFEPKEPEWKLKKAEADLKKTPQSEPANPKDISKTS